MSILSQNQNNRMWAHINEEAGKPVPELAFDVLLGFGNLESSLYVLQWLRKDESNACIPRIRSQGKDEKCPWPWLWVMSDRSLQGRGQKHSEKRPWVLRVLALSITHQGCLPLWEPKTERNWPYSSSSSTGRTAPKDHQSLSHTSFPVHFAKMVERP